MIINLVLDAAAQAAPTAWKNTMQQAANLLGSMFTDNITVNINIDYSGTGGGAAAGPDNGTFVAYSTVYNYLTTHASPGDSSFTYLPVPGSANAPTEVVVWNAQLKAMGLLSANDTTTDDGSATFATDINPSLLLGVALHELTHAIGRVPYGSPDIMELDRFSSAGNRVYDGGVPAGEASYFSLNGGLTKWAQYGVNSDPSDFLNAANYGGDGTSPLTPNDPFNQYYTGNTLQHLTPVDLELMDTLGFHLKNNAPAIDAYDFNGSNSGDILLQNASGQIEYINMAGGSDQGPPVNVANVPGWTVVGEGKISGGVDSDIVIRNASGQVEYANMVNGSFSNFVSIGDPVGYNVVGVGDINDDHYADIVLQNFSTGSIAYANMANGVFNNWVGLPGTLGWNVMAVADINGDGYADLVLQNQTNNYVVYANMDNGVFNNWVAVGDPVGWKVVGAGDIAGDGYADLVIQNQSNGYIDYANMVNGVFNNWVGVGDPVGWNVIAVEDVLGNGFDDIVIQNSSGQIAYANMTGGSFQGWVAITSTPGYTGSAGPAPVGDTATTAGVTATTTGSMLGPGFAVAGGQTDLPPVGTQIHLPMFGAWLDGNSSSGDPFGQSTSASANLPIGVWEATHYAGNGNNNNGAGGSFADSSGSGQGSSNSSDTGALYGPQEQSNSGDLTQMGLNLPPVGTQIHLPMFGAWLDGNSSSGDPFGQSTSASPNLPIGVWEATHYAGNSNNNNGAAGSFVENAGGISASWLTDGARNGSMPTNGAAQVPSNFGPGNNPAPIVTADNLQNLLHSS